MMGSSHALSGAAVFLAAAPILPTPDPTAVELACGAAITAGAAMLPDLDHPQSTATRVYGPVTRVLASLVTAVSGGHRQGTHSLLGVAVFTAAIAAATSLGPAWLAAAVLLLVGAAARAVGVTIAAAAVVAAVVFTHTTVVGLLPYAVAVGVTAHIAGDCVTGDGCPLAWPLSGRDVGVHLFNVGSAVERFAVRPALTVGLVALVIAHSGWWHTVTRLIENVTGSFT